MNKTTIGFGDFLYGYVDGDRFMISNTVEQICAFILKYRFKNVSIINLLDVMEIETSMGFIQYCHNQKFLGAELIPILAPMQMGETEIPEFIPYAPEQEYLVCNVRLNSEDGYFLGIVDFEEGFPQIYDKQSGCLPTEQEVLKTYPNSISVAESREKAIQKGWLKEE